MIDYKDLAGRIKTLADRYEDSSLADGLREEIADLRTVVSLLHMLGGQTTVPDNSQEWSRLDGIAAFLLIERHADGWADAGKMMEEWRVARSHPAPHPTAIPAPFMHLLGHAYGLSLGTDWNRGTHAKHYRRPLLDAVSECERWLDSAPQRQPKKCGCRSCLTPAELLCTFVVCPECGDKRCPRADDHRNDCTSDNVPQPQPVLSGYSDYGAAIPGIERPCTCHPDDNPPVPCAQQYALNECRAASEPTEAQIELPNIVKTAPERIYLVIGEDCPDDATFSDDEVTWCADKIDDNSIPYVRADRAALAAKESKEDNDAAR